MDLQNAPGASVPRPMRNCGCRADVDRGMSTAVAAPRRRVAPWRANDYVVLHADGAATSRGAAALMPGDGIVALAAAMPSRHLATLAADRLRYAHLAALATDADEACSHLGGAAHATAGGEVKLSGIDSQ